MVKASREVVVWAIQAQLRGFLLTNFVAVLFLEAAGELACVCLAG